MLAAIVFICYRLARGVSSDVGAALTAFAVFAAAAAVGAALGFLFGLPRSRLTDQMLVANGNGNGTEAGGSGATAGAQRRFRSSKYLANSNLIKVSDWLTTIIIGLGLTNLDGVGSAVGRLHDILSKPLGGAAFSGTLGVSIVVAASVLGFVLVYTWTSIRLRELLEEAEAQYRA